MTDSLDDKDELVPGDSFFEHDFLFPKPNLNSSELSENEVDGLVKKFDESYQKTNKPLPRRLCGKVYGFFSENKLLYAGSGLALSVLFMDLTVRSAQEDTLSTLFYSVLTVGTSFVAGTALQNRK